MRIADIIANKGSSVATVRGDATVADAVGELARHAIGALVVSDDGLHVQGIVSERDVVRLLAREHDELLGHSVSSIMSSPVHTCAMTDEVASVMATMTDRRIRHLPVIEDGRMRGLVSIGDVVKSTIEQLQEDRRLLEEYITAR